MTFAGAYVKSVAVLRFQSHAKRVSRCRTLPTRLWLTA